MRKLTDGARLKAPNPSKHLKLTVAGTAKALLQSVKYFRGFKILL